MTALGLGSLEHAKEMDHLLAPLLRVVHGDPARLLTPCAVARPTCVERVRGQVEHLPAPSAVLTTTVLAPASTFEMLPSTTFRPSFPSLSTSTAVFFVARYRAVRNNLGAFF